jgi:hypothetical protein
LEQVIRESNQSAREHCERFNRTAVARQEYGATLSYRQLTRWMAGEVTQARAASMRIAEWHWGEPFTVLVGPPRPRPQPFEGALGGDQPEPVAAADDGVRIGLRLYVPAGLGRDRPDGSPIDCGTFAFSLARVLAESGELVTRMHQAARGIDPTFVDTRARQQFRAQRLHDRLARPGWVFQPSWCECRDVPA